METIDQLENNEIIKVGGVLGRVLNYNKDYNPKFRPANYGNYYLEDLVDVLDFEETTHEEKISFLIEEFSWGRVVNSFSVGDFQILEFIINKTGELGYHGYRNYRDMHMSWGTLDQALVGLIARKYDGPNSQAAFFFYKMVDM